MKRILTYGTFDLLHYGHIRLLKRAKAMGDYLIVALSTDEFNAGKGKKAYHTYETRKKMLEAIRYVDLVIPEESWSRRLTTSRNITLIPLLWAVTGQEATSLIILRIIASLYFLTEHRVFQPLKLKRTLGFRRQ